LAASPAICVHDLVAWSSHLRHRGKFGFHLALAVIAALTAGVFANRNAANLTRSEAQRLPAEANSLMLKHGDTNLIALLTIRSLNMQYTPAGDGMLTSLTTLEAPLRELRSHTGGIWGVDVSADGIITS
jgi:hypothetical protein